MRLSHSEVAVDVCAKFFRTVHVFGWVRHDSVALREVGLLNCEHVAQACRVGLRANFAEENSLGFSLDVMLKDEGYPFEALIVFSFSDGSQQTIALYDLVYERLAAAPTFAVYRRFLESTASPDYRRILDIGGRDRSQIDRRTSFPTNAVTVLDVLPGDNVDIVGDAHDLSQFAAGSFDAAHSTSVFEHLLMPWKVVLEMNRVLRPGGLVYVHTHQALGMHDLPCDFWRFSADAWKALFNRRTGFEILETAMSHETFLIPLFWRPDKIDAEKAAGFETSVVLARKVGEAALSWDVSPAEVGAGLYPHA